MDYIYSGSVNMESILNNEGEIVLKWHFYNIENELIKCEYVNGIFVLEKNRRKEIFKESEIKNLNLYYDFEYIYEILINTKEKILIDNYGESYNLIEINMLKKYGIFRKEFDIRSCVMCTLIDRISTVTSINLIIKDKKENLITIDIKNIFEDKDSLYYSLKNKPSVKNNF